MAFAALILAGCASSEVVYERAGVLTAEDLQSASSTSFLFRVPRSQILLNPAGGEKRLHASVLDPVATSEWTVLPYNPGFYYRISMSRDVSGTLSMNEFEAALGKSVKVFPVPSCRTAHLEIGVPETGDQPSAFKNNPLKLEIEAVATEYDYPADDGTVFLSPLYRANPDRGWFAETRFSVVKYPNTHMVKSISVEVWDLFSETITILAGIAKTGIGAMKGFSVPSGDILPVFSTSLTVADNRRIALAPLPRKGNISLHAICGAQVSEQGSSASLDFLKNAQTAIAKAKELYDVWNRSAHK